MKSMDPCDTCRKECFLEHSSSRGVSPWGCRETTGPGPPLLRGKAFPWGRTSSSSSTDQSSSQGLVPFCTRDQDTGNVGRTRWAQGTVLLWCMYMWVVAVTWQSPLCCCPSPGMDGAEKGIRRWPGPEMVMGLGARLGISEQEHISQPPCVLDSEFLILIDSSFKAHCSPCPKGFQGSSHPSAKSLCAWSPGREPCRDQAAWALNS